MRLLKRIALVLLALILIFVAHVVISTGFFRSIKPQFDGRILQKIALPGAEDIMVSRMDSFAIISSTNRQGFPKSEKEKGGLFLIDLKQEPPFVPIPLTNTFKEDFAPHGISWFKKDSTYQLHAISHTSEGHTIEVFELLEQNLKHIETIKHSTLISPNDLVSVDEKRFYFTNDHAYEKGVGRLMEDYGGLGVSNVIYFDGTNFKEVAKGISYANGINIDRKRNLLFVASPRKFQVKVYSINTDGTLAFVENIDCGTGVDNIEFDEDGNLWIGCHPNLLRFSAYAKGNKKTTPSEIIKIDYRRKGDYSIEQIYMEDGNEMSGSTVAATFDKLIFVGNVMDDAFLVLERNP